MSVEIPVVCTANEGMQPGSGIDPLVSKRRGNKVKIGDAVICDVPDKDCLLRRDNKCRGQANVVDIFETYFQITPV